jgi:cytochrome d ubiquinol oxidase subunit II
MFENLTLLELQQYWWFIVSLLGALLVFMMFVQGGQTLIYTVGKSETERTMIINSLGRKWELTFTTLVTFGGAFFASFPLFYSTSFGGAYWVWMAILIAFVLQAVSFEFRKKPGNLLGERTYEFFLMGNGILGTLLIGTAVATFFTGSQFAVNKMNILNAADQANLTISYWTGPAHGLEAVFNLTNLALGLAVFFLARIIGAMYFMNNIDDENIFQRARKQVLLNSLPFLVFFLFFLGRVLLQKGFAVNPESGLIVLQPLKYLHNFMQMPLILGVFVVGVLLVLFGIIIAWFKHSSKGMWYSGTGSVLVVLTLLLNVGYNNTAFYPAFDPNLPLGSSELQLFIQSSLTIQNSSSSHYTLTAMSYVSLLVPFVLAYIVIVWKSMNNKKIDSNELNQESHTY